MAQTPVEEQDLAGFLREHNQSVRDAPGNQVVVGIACDLRRARASRRLAGQCRPVGAASRTPQS